MAGKTLLGKLDRSAFGALETVAVNQPVRITVVADECGVGFVPCRRAADVVAVAWRLADSEAQRLANRGNST
jgi:hypothetical protein